MKKTTRYLSSAFTEPPPPPRHDYIDIKKLLEAIRKNDKAELLKQPKPGPNEKAAEEIISELNIVPPYVQSGPNLVQNEGYYAKDTPKLFSETVITQNETTKPENINPNLVADEGYYARDAVKINCEYSNLKTESSSTTESNESVKEDAFKLSSQIIFSPQNRLPLPSLSIKKDREKDSFKLFSDSTSTIPQTGISPNLKTNERLKDKVSKELSSQKILHPQTYIPSIQFPNHKNEANELSDPINTERPYLNKITYEVEDKLNYVKDADKITLEPITDLQTELQPTDSPKESYHVEDAIYLSSDGTLTPPETGIPPTLIPEESLMETYKDEEASETISSPHTGIPPILIQEESISEKYTDELPSETISPPQTGIPPTLIPEENLTEKYTDVFPSEMQKDLPNTFTQENIMVKKDIMELSSEKSDPPENANPNLVGDEGYYAKDAVKPTPEEEPTTPPPNKDSKENNNPNLTPINCLKDSKSLDLAKPLMYQKWPKHLQEYIKPLTQFWLSAASKFSSTKPKNKCVPYGPTLLTPLPPSALICWPQDFKIPHSVITKAHGSHAVKLFGSALLLSIVVGSNHRVLVDWAKRNAYQKVMSCQCPPPTPSPCKQTCPPPAPPPTCKPKPIMRGMHYAQTSRILPSALILSACIGLSIKVLLGIPRKKAIADYYLYNDMMSLADDIRKKGYFQSVPQGGYKK